MKLPHLFIQTKGLDEESEASLLTALTEILDNVGDENLSPFDTLPDADLLSKGREHSPVSFLLSYKHSGYMVYYFYLYYTFTEICTLKESVTPALKDFGLEKLLIE